MIIAVKPLSTTPPVDELLRRRIVCSAETTRRVNRFHDSSTGAKQ